MFTMVCHIIQFSKITTVSWSTSTLWPCVIAAALPATLLTQIILKLWALLCLIYAWLMSSWSFGFRGLFVCKYSRLMSRKLKYKQNICFINTGHISTADSANFWRCLPKPEVVKHSAETSWRSHSNPFWLTWSYLPVTRTYLSVETNTETVLRILAAILFQEAVIAQHRYEQLPV